MLNGKNMNSKTNKILFIILIILISIGAIFLYYLYTKKSSGDISNSEISMDLPTSNGTNGGIDISSGDLPGVSIENDDSLTFADNQKKKLFQLSSQNVVDYWISSTTDLANSGDILKDNLYYINKDGEIHKILKGNSDEVIATSPYGPPVSINQSLDGSKVVVSFESGKVALYSIDKKTWELLTNNISSASISPDGKSVAYLTLVKGTKNLYIKDINRTKPITTLIISLAIQDVSIDWVDNDRIFLLPKQSKDFEGQIWYIDIKTKTLKFYGSGFGFSAIFSKLNNLSLSFSSQNYGKKMLTSFSDKSGNNKGSASFATFKEKCVFSYSTPFAYCAIPKNSNRTSSVYFPDDFLKKSIFFNDYIYKVDVENKVFYNLLSLDSMALDAISLKEKNNQLFFINRLDNKLYMYKIEE